MGRFRSRPTSAQPADLSASSPTKQQPHKRRKKNGYKVILESVTQKRKKLRLSASFNQNAPPGYTFVEFGNAKLSAQCKEFCRKRGELAYSVSAPPKNNATVDPEKISYHVNRVGWHFPNKIVDLAAEWLGIVPIGRRKSENGSGFTQNLGRRLKALVDLSEEDRVRAAMKDLFPRMPRDSLEAIVEHAFAEGAKRVGNATNLSLERRVQMAVLAHVRHKHTDYDKLLKEVGYIQARKSVENPCIEKILEWRGENADEDDDIVEMEDDFREIVVLDDSDDNEESESDLSVEYAPVHQSPGHHNTYTQSRSIDPKSTQAFGRPQLPQRQVLRQRIPHQPEVAHAWAPRGYNQPPVELDHRPRNVVIRDAQPLGYSYDRGGRSHPEHYFPRRAAEQKSYGGQPMLHHSSGRLIARENHVPQVANRAAPDARIRGEPQPEDVVVPSIEGDDLSLAQPANGNKTARYISHQERSLMQRPMEHESEIQARRKVDSKDDRVWQANVIDLTGSPVHHRSHHFMSGPAHEFNFPSDERYYYDRRPVEWAVDPGTKNKEPSLQLLPGGVGRAGPAGSRSDQLRDNRSNAEPPTRKRPPPPRPQSVSHVANEQVFTTKRRSGNWNEAPQGPAPSYRSWAPAVAGRQSGDSRPGPEQPFMMSSPVRMQPSGAYKDVAASVAPIGRQSTEYHRDPPSQRPAHYFDYPRTPGDVRRHDGHAGSYR